MPDHLIDSELIDRLKHDDDIALSIIYKKYWQMLYVSAHNILKDQQACEDIIQELFIKLWNNRHAVEINVSLKAYLYASIRYEVYRQIKSGAVRDDIYDNLLERLQTPETYHNIEYKELIGQINSVVNQLPEKCREVYKLSREEQLSHKQIAERLNISPKTVENQITKALRYLRTSLTTTLIAAIVYFLVR
ncbi:MAG: RNA polymerase sigma-70 factor [Bacteroidota bacterium]|nr:RNA polymerase sigma-70 factor [Bacteroidota bacterium]